MRAFLLAISLMFIVGVQAHAYWQYAEWGMSPMQIATASRGEAIPCQTAGPACTGAPGLVIGETEMLGLRCSVAFFFDGQGHLNRTVVTFKNTDFAMIAGLLNGIHGDAVTDPAAATPSGVWRDTRRGSTIVVNGAGPVVTMSYQPANQ